MQPMVAGDVLVGCVGANSAGSGKPHFLPGHRAEIHRQLTGANIMMLAGEKHRFFFFGGGGDNVMNDINYSTVESWRNSRKHTVAVVVLLVLNMEHAGSKVLFIRPHASVMAEGNYNTERPHASLCKDNTKTVQPAHDVPLTPVIITRTSLIFRSA